MTPPFQSTKIGEEHQRADASKKTKVRKYAALLMASVVAVASLAWIWQERGSSHPVVDVGSTNIKIASPESRLGSPSIVRGETPKSANTVSVEAAPAVPVASDVPKATVATATPRNDTTDSVKASSQIAQSVSRPTVTAKATAAQSAASVVDPLPRARNFYATGDGVLRPDVASSVGGSKSPVAQSQSPPSAPAVARADASQVRDAALQPFSSAAPVVQESAESSTWKRAMTSQSAFDLMAYLAKFPAGEHANEAQKLIVKAQRTSEGCLLRYPTVRTFSWSGKCGDGMATGVGVLKWMMRSGLARTIAGRGAFSNGVMVGRWTFDSSFTAPVGNPIVRRVIDFDNAGNVSIQQHHTHQDGEQYDGETNAGSDNYWGYRHGKGITSYPTGANVVEFRGLYSGGKRNGPGVVAYRKNSKFKRLTGQWVDNQLEGLGALAFQDGTALSGYFKAGKSGPTLDGVVKKLRADGSVAETQAWRDGKPEGSHVSPIKGF